jgi:hypothetical protein
MLVADAHLWRYESNIPAILPTTQEQPPQLREILNFEEITFSVTHVFFFQHV